jgi:hypothetical protein
MLARLDEERLNHPRSRAGVPEDHAYGVASTEVRSEEGTLLPEKLHESGGMLP